MGANDDLPVTLRIEVRRAGALISVVLIDPTTSELGLGPSDEKEFFLARDVDPHKFKEVSRGLLHKLDVLSRGAPGDPDIRQEDQGWLAFKIYGAGQAALLRLCSPEEAARLVDAKQFCAKLLTGRLPHEQIVQIVCRREDHLPFEVLPMLGDLSDPTSDTVDNLGELRRAVLGLSAICHHGDLAPSETKLRLPYRLGVRLFRHHALPGATLDERHLRELPANGAARLCEVFPSKGYKPDPHAPELALVREVARPFSSESPPRGKGSTVGSVAHFSCHILKSDDQVRLELCADGWRSDPIPYPLDDLEVAADMVQRSLKSPPFLIFLAACKSGTEDQLTYTSAVKALERLRPMSVIGSVASIPDMLTAEFTRVFYATVADHGTVGAAILASKLQMINAPYSNPFSLLFVSYYGEEVAVAKRLERLVPPSVYAGL